MHWEGGAGGGVEEEEAVRDAGGAFFSLKIDVYDGDAVPVRLTVSLC